MCDCIDKVNKELEARNTELALPMLVILDTGQMKEPDRIVLATRKIDTKKRGHPIALFAAYCPVFGEKYPEPPAKTETVTTLPIEQESKNHE